MSSTTNTNNNNTDNVVIVDNKQLQQANNNNNNNNHLNDDAAPPQDNKAASLVTLSSMYSPSPIPSTSASVAYCAARLKAAALAADGQTQRPIHVSVALDVSGSMSGDRLDTAKEALKFVADQLRDQDELGIVTFSNNVGVALQPTKMTTTGKAAAVRAITQCRAGGSTNLSGGLFASLNQVTGGTQPYLMNTPVPIIPVAPAAPTTIPVVISFTYDANGNKPEEKHRYKLVIAPPAVDSEKIAKYTVHDPESRFSDILGSGESEFELKPLPSVVQHLDITFELNNGSTHKVQYFLGEVANAKRTIQVPLVAANNKNHESPSIRPRDHQNDQNKDGVLRVVFLFTDGHANVGIQDAATLVAETKSRLAQSPKDATIFTYGFGANHNASMLTDVANAGEGMFYFIENTSTLAETFADCLGGLFSTVAQDVKVTAKLQPGKGVRFSTVMSKFRHEIKDDGNTIVISMKDLYAEESRDLLIELNVDGPTAKSAIVEDPNSVGVQWLVEYSDAASKNNNNNGSSARVVLRNMTSFVISSDSAPVINEEVDEQVQRFKSIQVMEEVKRDADAGRLEEARKKARDYSTQLQAAPSAARAGNQMLQQQMCNLEEMALDTTTWGARGSKVVNNYAQSHAMQRGNAVSEDCAYAGNVQKMAMRKKAKDMSSKNS